MAMGLSVLYFDGLHLPYDALDFRFTAPAAESRAGGLTDLLQRRASSLDQPLDIPFADLVAGTKELSDYGFCLLAGT